MSRARFEVSTEGMRALHIGREPWQLAKELVSNAWDESASRCEVVLRFTSSRRAVLTVYDDGPGFADIKDAWTLMGHTPKRGDPNVRGRFNIGEKEILSVAVVASITTRDYKITFPRSGGRRITKMKPQALGTTIRCTLPWGHRQVESTIEALKLLLTPKGITYTVNSEQVPYQAPSKTFEATLETVLQDAPGEPVRTTRRKTNVELIPAERGILYEMGVPVQEIGCPWHVNIMQKVPLPPNRDVVRDSYLQDVYTVVLNNTADEIVQPSETWIRTALEDKDIEPEAVKTVMTKRYGERVVLWSSNAQANERAIEHGYEIVHPRTLSSAERDAMEGVGLEHSSERFALTPAPAQYLSGDDLTEGMKMIAEYAKMLARELLNMSIGVEFYRLPHGVAAAEWDNRANMIRFNVSNLGKTFFDKIGSDQTGTILHELAHVKGNGHDWQYKNSIADLAGKAVHLAVRKPELFKEVGTRC